MVSIESNANDPESLSRKVSELDESLLSMQDSLAAVTDIIDSLVGFKESVEGGLADPKMAQELSVIEGKLDRISKAQEHTKTELSKIKQTSHQPGIVSSLEKANLSKDLLNELSSKVDEAQGVKSQISTATSIQEELTASLADAEETSARLDSLLKEKEESDKRERQERDDALTKLRSRIEQSDEHMREAAQETSSKLESLLKEKEESDKRERQERDDALTKLRSRIEQLDENMQDLSAKNSIAEAEDITTLKTETDTLAHEIADASYDITTIQQRSKLLDERISDSNEFSKEQFEKILSILKLKTELLEKISSENAKMRGGMADMILDMENLKMNAEKRITSLSKRVQVNMESIPELEVKTKDRLDAIQLGVEGKLAEFSVELSNVSPDKIKEMDNKVSEDRMLIGKLTVLIKKLQETYDPTKINALRMKVERVETILKDIEEGKSTIMDKITTLDGQVAKVDLGRIITLVDKVETVRNEIGQLSKSIALPADMDTKVSNLQDKVRYLERETEKHADTHKVIKQLDTKMAVMKEHVRSIKDEVKKKKNMPVHIGKEYLVLD